jgi:hypothetical protein
VKEVEEYSEEAFEGKEWVSEGEYEESPEDEEADTKQTILMQFIERPEVPEDTDEPEGMDGEMGEEEVEESEELPPEEYDDWEEEEVEEVHETEERPRKLGVPCDLPIPHQRNCQMLARGRRNPRN